MLNFKKNGGKTPIHLAKKSMIIDLMLLRCKKIVAEFHEGCSKNEIKY